MDLNLISSKLEQLQSTSGQNKTQQKFDRSQYLCNPNELQINESGQKCPAQTASTQNLPILTNVSYSPHLHNN